MARPKTIICDIDGTLVRHKEGCGPSHILTNPAELLEGTIDKLEEWEKKGYNIILLTGRKESFRKKTEQDLQELGIFYDQLIMGVGGGARVLVNDLKPGDSEDNPTAVAITIKRNAGISGIEV